MGVIKMNWNGILLSRDPNAHKEQEAFTQISTTG
jgi:hypothetical protein